MNSGRDCCGAGRSGARLGPSCAGRLVALAAYGINRRICNSLDDLTRGPVQYRVSHG